MMVFLNLIAFSAIFVSIGERLAWARFGIGKITQENKDKFHSKQYIENTSGYYYILVAFIFFFNLILLMAELRSIWARQHFSFLDHKQGRGLFIIFLALMIP
jgi:hypothetical protein